MLKVIHVVFIKKVKNIFLKAQMQTSLSFPAEKVQIVAFFSEVIFRDSFKVTKNSNFDSIKATLTHLILVF